MEFMCASFFVHLVWFVAHDDRRRRRPSMEEIFAVVKNSLPSYSIAFYTDLNYLCENAGKDASR